MAKKAPTKEELRIAELKDQYIKYYVDVPIQRYAAMYVGRDEDTILRWKREDAEFAERINQAHSKWVRSKLVKAKVEFALERLEKSIFKESTETTVHLPSPILGGVTNEVRTDDSSTEAPTA